MVRLEHHQRVVGKPGRFQRIEHPADNIVRSPHRGVVHRDLFPDLRQIRQETRHDDFVRLIDSRWRGEIAGVPVIFPVRRSVDVGKRSLHGRFSRIEWSMRIGCIDHEEKWPIRAPGIAQELRDECSVQVRASPVQQFFAWATVLKGVFSRRHNMVGLAEDSGVIIVLPQRFRQGRYAGPYLIEAERPVVVRIATGHPDCSRRLANRHRHVRVLEPQPLGGKPVDVRRRVRNLRAVHAHRVPIHVVHRDEQNIQAVGGHARQTRDSHAEPRQDPSTFHIACFVVTLRASIL